MAEKIILKGYDNEQTLHLLQSTGCQVEKDGDVTSIEIPGDCVWARTWESRVGTQEIVYIYCYVYELEGNARLVFREKIKGTLGRMKTRVELLALLNVKGG